MERESCPGGYALEDIYQHAERRAASPEFAAHVPGCEVCRRALQQVEAFEAGVEKELGRALSLESLRDAPPAPPAWSRRRDRLLGRREVRHGRVRLLGPALLLAATLLLAVNIFWRASRPAPSSLESVVLLAVADVRSRVDSIYAEHQAGVFAPKLRSGGGGRRRVVPSPAFPDLAAALENLSGVPEISLLEPLHLADAPVLPSGAWHDDDGDGVVDRRVASDGTTLRVTALRPAEDALQTLRESYAALADPGASSPSGDGSEGFLRIQLREPRWIRVVSVDAAGDWRDEYPWWPVGSWVPVGAGACFVPPREAVARVPGPAGEPVDLPLSRLHRDPGSDGPLFFAPDHSCFVLRHGVLELYPIEWLPYPQPLRVAAGRQVWLLVSSRDAGDGELPAAGWVALEGLRAGEPRPGDLGRGIEAYPIGGKP